MPTLTNEAAAPIPVQDVRAESEVGRPITEARDLHALLSRLPGMAYRRRLSPELPMEFASAGSIALCGYSPVALTRSNPHWGDVIHADDRETVWQSVREGLQRERHIDIEYRIVTRDNATKVVWEQGSLIDSPEHGSTIEGFITDITPRLHAEALQREQHERLAHLDRLSLLGEITAGVAHEINQPLTTISTCAQSCLRFNRPDNARPDRLQDALIKLSQQAQRQALSWNEFASCRETGEPIEHQTVMIVDDDEAVRDSLSMLLESVGLPHRLYASATEFLSELEQLPRGCLVLDIRMPGMSGLELQEELRNKELALPIIFITGHGDVGLAVQAMRNGALDFIPKPYREQDLLDRIHEALAIEAGEFKVIHDRAGLLARVATLSNRERQVFESVAEGKANKAIAYDLDISERTVEVHRSQAMKKLNARTVAELVRVHLEIERPQGATPMRGLQDVR